MKIKKIGYSSVALTVVIVCMLFAISGQSDNKDDSNQEVPQSHIKEDFNKSAAISAAKEIVISPIDEDQDVDTLIAGLENSATLKDSINEATYNRLHLVDLLADETAQRTTGIVILSLHKMYLEINKLIKSEDLTIVDEAVYLDEATKTAHVTLDVVLGYSSGFSMEMVYIDGYWKFSPFSLIRAIELSEIILQNYSE